MQTAASCGGVQPCNKLDMLTTNPMHKVTFKVQTTLTNGVVFTSNTIEMDVQCGHGSTTITSTLTEADWLDVWYEQWNTLNNTYSWPIFTCQYSDCCQTLTYYVAQDTSHPVNAFPTAGPSSNFYTSPTLGVVSGHRDFGRMWSELYTGDMMAPYNIYIYCKNEWTDYVISQAVQVRVVYDCSMDVIEVNSTTYSEAYEGTMRDTNTSYENYTWVNSLPVLYMNETQKNISYYSAEMKYRFVNNASAYCPLINYRISRIMQKQSMNWVPKGTFQNMFGIGDTNGTFWVSHFDNPFYRWYIYL